MTASLSTFDLQESAEILRYFSYRWLSKEDGVVPVERMPIVVKLLLWLSV